MNIISIKLKEEIQKFDSKNYVLTVNELVIKQTNSNKKVSDYKTILSPDLYDDLNTLYTNASEISFSWAPKQKVNDKKLLAQKWVKQALFEERGFSLSSIDECLGGVLNIVSLEEMMSDKFYTNLFDKKGVEYLPLDRNWTRVACLKKKNGLVENNVYFFESEDHEKVYDMKVGVQEYIQLAYQAKCFYDWQYAFLFQKKESFANQHLRIMLPKLLPHLELDLSPFGINLETASFDEEKLYNAAPIKTYTSFPKEEEKLTRYLMSIDKNVFCSGNADSYNVRFESSFPEIDFTQFTALYSKFTADKKPALPSITLNNIPDNCDLSSLENATNIDALSLTFVGEKSIDLSSWKGKSIKHIETLWIWNLKDLHRIDFLHAFPNLSNLKLFNLTNCQIEEDWSFLTKLESLQINAAKPFNSPIATIKLPESTKSLTLVMNVIESIPNIEGKSLEYLEIKSQNLSKIEKLDTLTQLKMLTLENGKITTVEGLDNLPNLKIISLKNNAITDFTNLANLPKGTIVRLSKKEFVTEDRKTNMRRRLKLKHLDLKLS